MSEAIVVGGVIAVTLNVFVKVYNEAKQMNQYPPRVFMREAGGSTTLLFKDIDFAYSTTILNSELDANRIKLMNVAGNLYEV